MSAASGEELLPETRRALLHRVATGQADGRAPSVTAGLADMRPGESEAGRAARMREQNPAGKVASLAELAAAVLYLASPGAAVVVGTDLVIDGGAAA
jgi:NAD(P)-dependent dehydrogenase (short-subunit alcohol dehydrogenase family)